MTWEIQKARVRIGLLIDDESRDPQLEDAMAIALAAAETYCDRGLVKMDEAQEFTAPIPGQLLVRRYPLVSLQSIQPLDPVPPAPGQPLPDDPPAGLVDVSTHWRMDKKRGIVFLYGPVPWMAGPGSIFSAPSQFGTGAKAGFILNYTGGYDPLPADLEAALWMAFDNVWGSTPGLGISGGGGVASDAPMKSFGIDGMSISYDTSGGKTASTSSVGLIPSTAIGILDSYRAESAALGG